MSDLRGTESAGTGYIRRPHTLLTIIPSRKIIPCTTTVCVDAGHLGVCFLTGCHVCIHSLWVLALVLFPATASARNNQQDRNRHQHHERLHLFAPFGRYCVRLLGQHSRVSGTCQVPASDKLEAPTASETYTQALIYLIASGHVAGQVSGLSR